MIIRANYMYRCRSGRKLNGLSDAGGLPFHLSMANEGHGVNLGCGEDPSINMENHDQIHTSNTRR
jgi:hypothetical protein